LVDHRLQVTGRWLSAHTVALDNRPLNGKSGFFVFTPLLNEASGKAVMVQRGWVPRDFADRSRVSTFSTPPGEVTVLGRIARAPPRTFQLGQVSSIAMLRQNLNLPDFERETRLDLWDHVLVQLDPAPVDGLSRDWPAPKLGTDTHYGYAFQWFGLCALIVALFVWFQLVPRFRHRATSATLTPPTITPKVPVSPNDPFV
jgi:surfeit locus 1 family protein